MTAFQTLDSFSFAGKKVLLRADLNVPVQNGVISDAARLTHLLPTLNDLSSAGARIIILSHFGRPDGKTNSTYSLRPIAQHLAKIWGRRVAFADDCIGATAQAAIDRMQNGDALVLENTRFHPGEEKNDPAFVQALAALGEVYVNDAFSTAHRAHASTEGLAHRLPSAAGRLMQAELEALNRVLSNPERPLAALVGGSKISTKLDLLQNLVSKVDLLVLGGGMANTFLAAQGIPMGKSLVERDMLDTARGIAAKAAERDCRLILPVDAVIAPALQRDSVTQTVAVDAVPGDQMMLDLGPQSRDQIVKALSTCKSLVWNGPLGAFEFPPFDQATNQVAQAAAALTREGKLLSVAGGGDTVAALTHAGVAADFSYVSMAGGAFLEWLEGKTLPGVAALQNSKSRP